MKDTVTDSKYKARIVLSPKHHPLYVTWCGMIDRCYRPGNNSYKNYGAKGARVCQEWIDSFEDFVLDMGLKPTDKHTLDRIDGTKNYEPSNCRWSTRAVQSFNKSNVNTEHYGVSFNKRYQKWLVHMTHDSVVVLNKMFDDLDEAIAARKAAEDKYLGYRL